MTQFHISQARAPSRGEFQKTALWAGLGRWLWNEPLVHFIALGALMFAVYGVLGAREADPSRRIEVTAQDVARLRDLSIKQWGKEPDAQTLQNLVQSFVREEVLYREAMAEGLARDDAIVRRRLAQKMEFLANAEVRPLADAEVRAYFETHAAQFQQPALVDFEQVFISTDARSQTAQAYGAGLLARLRQGKTVVGDPFMLPAQGRRLEQTQLARDYGADFAQALFQLPVGAWSGPLRSPLGLHLVRVTKHDPAQPARLEDVRERVAAEALNAAVENVRRQAYERVLARYTVVLPADVTPGAPS